MNPIKEFQTPFGLIQMFKTRGVRGASSLRSYDDIGRMYVLSANSHDNIAIDVERYTQKIPDVFLSFLEETDGSIEFYSKWTIAEGISKLTNVPILSRIKGAKLFMFPLEEIFVFEEGGIRYKGVTWKFESDEILITVLECIR